MAEARYNSTSSLQQYWPLNPFFSKRAVAVLQPRIEEVIEDLCSGLRRCIEKHEVVELNTAFLSLALDVIFRYAYGKAFGALKEPGFAPQWHRAIQGTAESAPLTKQLSDIVQYLQNLPLPVIKFLHPNLGQLLSLRKVLRRQVASIISQYNDGRLPSKELSTDGNRTIFHAIMESELPLIEKQEERLTDEAFAFIGAGTETTKQSLSSAMFYLLSNSNHMIQLKKELWKAMPSALEIPEIHILESLPYLRSVVNETLRISTSVTSRLPLVAPTQALVYKDWVIPPGTPISMDLRSTMMDPQIFPCPHVFSPERWLRAAERGESLERWLMPFSRGTRACLGQNLALAEIYLTLAILLRQFEFELFDTNKRAVEVTRDRFAAGMDKKSRGVRVKVLSEHLT